MNIELKIPAVGESISEVTISKWLKKDGDYVEMDEAVAEIESDKATVELNATSAGTLKILSPEGNDIKIGAIAATIDTDAKAPEKATAKVETKTEPLVAKPATAASSANYATGTPSPAAAKILTEKGINPTEVNGTGKDGRITKDDAANASAKPEIIANTITSAGYGTVNATREQRREKMSNLRKAVAKRLVAAKNETAMLTTFNEVNMQPIMDIRNKYKEKFKTYSK